MAWAIDTFRPLLVRTVRRADSLSSVDSLPVQIHCSPGTTVWLLAHKTGVAEGGLDRIYHSIASLWGDVNISGPHFGIWYLAAPNKYARQQLQQHARLWRELPDPVRPPMTVHLNHPGDSPLLQDDSRVEAAQVASATQLKWVLCHQCNSGQETVLLLECSTCDKSMHTFCLNPRRFMIAQRETWRCNWCLSGDSPVEQQHLGRIPEMLLGYQRSSARAPRSSEATYLGSIPCGEDRKVHQGTGGGHPRSRVGSKRNEEGPWV